MKAVSGLKPGSFRGPFCLPMDEPRGDNWYPWSRWTTISTPTGGCSCSTASVSQLRVCRNSSRCPTGAAQWNRRLCSRSANAAAPTLASMVIAAQRWCGLNEDVTRCKPMRWRKICASNVAVDSTQVSSAPNAAAGWCSSTTRQPAWNMVCVPCAAAFHYRLDGSGIAIK